MRCSALVLSSLLVSGTFAAGQTGFTTKTYPMANSSNQSLRVADFNHDGRPDLFAYGGGGLVFLNDGSGGFKAGVALASTGTIVEARTGDLNGDGVPDIAAIVVTPGAGGAASTNSLVIFKNDGAGSFTLAQTVALPAAAAGLEVGDVNHDGHLDVVVGAAVTDASNGTVNNMLSTYFGNASGTLGTPVVQQNISLDDAADPSGIFVNCGLLNLTGADYFQDGQFSILLKSTCNFDATRAGTTVVAHGDGTGHFSVMTAEATYHADFNGLASDVNMDGKIDAVFTTDAGSHGVPSLEYLANNGAGSFAATLLRPNISGTPIQFFGVTAADLNGDGLKEIATTFSSVDDSYTFGTLGVSVFGLTGGAFSQTQNWSEGGSQLGALASADFDGDGRQDLATVVFESNGGGATIPGTANLYIFTNTPGSNSCAMPSAANSVNVCSPVAGATTASPIVLTAASNVGEFTLNRFYLDSKNVYETPAQSVNSTIAAAAGKHTLKMVSYDASGNAYTSTTTFTVGAVTPPPTGCLPSAAGVAICAPKAGATVSSPVTITAGAMVASGNITAVRAYIDSVAVFTTNNPAKATTQQVSQPVTVAAGSHKLTVVGYASTGGSVTSTETFTVGGASPCYPSAAGAKICSPAAGSTASSPVTLVAGATSGSGTITAIRVYVDNVAKTTVSNPAKSVSFAINTPLTLAPGKHNVVVVGYQSNGASVSAGESLTVK